jgi:hypothetical protein
VDPRNSANGPVARGVHGGDCLLSEGREGIEADCAFVFAD